MRTQPIINDIIKFPGKPTRHGVVTRLDDNKAYCSVFGQGEWQVGLDELAVTQEEGYFIVRH